MYGPLPTAYHRLHDVCSNMYSYASVCIRMYMSASAPYPYAAIRLHMIVQMLPLRTRTLIFNTPSRRYLHKSECLEVVQLELHSRKQSRF